jgi:RNA polymerase sigma-70 factor, ECF subfamily
MNALLSRPVRPVALFLQVMPWDNTHISATKYISVDARPKFAINSPPARRSIRTMEADRTRSSLLQRLHDPNDRQSWGEFYEVYHPLLLRYIRSHEVGPEDAEDLVQDIFINKLRQAMTTFDFDRQRGRFRTWLFEVTINAIRDWARKRQNRPAAVGQESDFTGPVVPSVTEELSRQWEQYHHEQIMQFAMKKSREFFEPKTWACFELRTLKGRPGPEVAAKLGLNINAVYTNAHRVLEKIRELCQQHDEELAEPSDPLGAA